MHPKAFSEFLEVMEKREHDLLFGEKNREYGAEEDKFAVNRAMAAAATMPLSQFFGLMLLKHAVSLYQSIKNGTWDWQWKRQDGTEGTKQRIADTVNYTHLMAGAIEEFVLETREKEGLARHDDRTARLAKARALACSGLPSRHSSFPDAVEAYSEHRSSEEQKVLDEALDNTKGVV